MTWRSLVATWHLIRDWSDQLTFSWILTRLLFFGFVDINRHYATQSQGRSRSRYRDPWMRYSLRPTCRTGFQKKDQKEDGDSRRKSYLLPKVFVTNLQFDQVRFFFNVTEVSVFFFISWLHNRNLGMHTGGVQGSPEAPGSKALPQWTLNSRVYAHTCRQTKEI